MPDYAYRNPVVALDALRSRVRGGARLRLESLSNVELEAAQNLIMLGEAEITKTACRPYLIARLDRLIID